MLLRAGSQADDLQASSKPQGQPHIPPETVGSYATQNGYSKLHLASTTYAQEPNAAQDPQLRDGSIRT